MARLSLRIMLPHTVVTLLSVTFDVLAQTSTEMYLILAYTSL